MVMNVILLLVGFMLLIKGADFLVDGSGSIARRLKISDLVIGLTIVAFGTSAPELIVSVVGSINGSNSLVLGNVIGSNLFNTLLIIGVCGTFANIKIKRATIRNEIPLAVIAGVLVLILGNGFLGTGVYGDGLSIIDGIILLFFFVIFLIYTFAIIKVEKDREEEPKDKLERKVSSPPLSPLKSALYIIAGLAGLYFGGNFVVENAVAIAELLNIGEKIIAVTIIATGTSLPELVTGIAAVRKGRNDMLMGNIVGSNIFNILLVLGIAVVISPIAFDSLFNTDLMFFIGGNIILLASMKIGIKNHIERWIAILMLLLYVGYITLLFI